MSKWSSAFRDSRWQQMRLRIMERDYWACCACGPKSENATLNVHHAYYEAGKAPWEYPEDALMTLCESCHTEYHRLQRKIQEAIAAIALEGGSPIVELRELAGYADACSGPPSEFEENYAKGYAAKKFMDSPEVVADALLKSLYGKAAQ